MGRPISECADGLERSGYAHATLMVAHACQPLLRISPIILDLSELSYHLSVLLTTLKLHDPPPLPHTVSSATHLVRMGQEASDPLAGVKVDRSEEASGSHLDAAITRKTKMDFVTIDVQRDLMEVDLGYVYFRWFDMLKSVLYAGKTVPW